MTKAPNTNSGLQSMTGFGRGDSTDAEVMVQAEIRSVNHRFLQVRVRAPRELSALERQIEERVRTQIQRGRVEVVVALNIVQASELAVDRERAAEVAKELRDLANALGLSGALSLDHLLAVPDLLNGIKVAESQAEPAVHAAVDEALGAFDRCRRREGEVLGKIVLERIEQLGGLLQQVLELAPERLRLCQERLMQRVQRLLPDRAVDEVRLLQEVAMYAEKLDIAEECDRIGAHLAEVRNSVQRGGAVGRRLDFLAQELHRECNTLGAKAYSSEIAQIVVGMKEEVERIREQVQNIV